MIIDKNSNMAKNIADRFSNMLIDIDSNIDRFDLDARTEAIIIEEIIVMILMISRDYGTELAGEDFEQMTNDDIKEFIDMLSQDLPDDKEFHDYLKSML